MFTTNVTTFKSINQLFLITVLDPDPILYLADLEGTRLWMK